MKSFQTLFPPLSPQTLTLSSARRIVLIAYNPDRGTVDFRHYVITVKPYGVSKRVRRVMEGTQARKKATPGGESGTGLLDLGNEKDVADFLLRKRGEPGPGSEGGDGYESAASSASSAAGDEDAAVNLADDYVGRGNKKGQRRAVRLDEIGPRMELRLVKIAEGVPGKEGSVIYHEFGEPLFRRGCKCELIFYFIVKKSKAEVAALKASHAEKVKIRKQRREEQERNVKRKKAKGKDGEGDDELEVSEGDGVDEDEGGWDDEEEISEGEDSVEETSDEDESEEDPESRPPPTKKVRFRGKR